MITVAALLLVAALVPLIAAHPHSYHTGECMEMRTSARSGRTQWISHPFKCMKDIKLPREERLARRICGRKAHDYMLSFFKGDKIDLLKHKDLEEVKTRRHEFFARCMVDRLGLEAVDGSLDSGKVLQNSLKMDSSDVSALMKMQTIINICVTNSTGVNATEQFLLLRGCVRRLVQEHCTLQQQLLRSYLERGRDASPACANVSTDYHNLMLDELIDACMAEQAVKAADGTKQLSVLASTNKGRFAQTMILSKICVAEKMNWISPETGFSGDLLRDFVSNFTWDFVPEGREEVLRAMEECDANLEGSVHNQVHQWESCFAPKIVEICGFNNNITKFFFPFINADIQKAALEYIEDLTDDDDSMEDLNDYDDDYDYDDYSAQDDDDDDDYDDENYDGKSYEDLDDNDDDDIDIDDDDYVKAGTVDDGLFEINLRSTRLETEKDAMMVSNNDDNLREIDGMKSKESVEDDAEEFMAHMKHKQITSPDAKTDSGKTKPETVTNQPSTEVTSLEFTTVSSETTVGDDETSVPSTQTPGSNDFEGELSLGEIITP
ncbi:uncharacterized protein [Palaemon carinicauda]|uniref:uncharacterized protein n=1 Tax=Palaemon carinicauda TaxID=392227 RepID=UPI0035B62486